MEWPLQSLDFNPIENLLTKFKVLFHKRFTELFDYPSKSIEVRYKYDEVLQEVWYNQGIELITALIELMLRQYDTVIEAKDGWTKY